MEKEKEEKYGVAESQGHSHHHGKSGHELHAHGDHKSGGAKGRKVKKAKKGKKGGDKEPKAPKGVKPSHAGQSMVPANSSHTNSTLMHVTPSVDGLANVHSSAGLGPSASRTATQLSAPRAHARRCSPLTRTTTPRHRASRRRSAPVFGCRRAPTRTSNQRRRQSQNPQNRPQSHLPGRRKPQRRRLLQQSRLRPQSRLWPQRPGRRWLGVEDRRPLAPPRRRSHGAECRRPPRHSSAAVIDESSTGAMHAYEAVTKCIQ